MPLINLPTSKRPAYRIQKDKPSKRIAWIDVTKFIGIFMIYLGHLRSSAGANTINFIFIFHVALFFFISGCMSNLDREPSVIKFTAKRFKQIMVPFFIFSIISAVIWMLSADIPTPKVKELFLPILTGNIRNQFASGAGLWFLSCLFVMEIVFKIIKKLKYSILIFTVSALIFFFISHVVNPGYLITPSWPYNIDSALYYMIFYALGYVSFPWIKTFFLLDTKTKKTFFIIFFIIGSINATLFFFNKSPLNDILARIPIISLFKAPIIASTLIFFTLVIAKILEHVPLFNKIGQNTLFLCGNESISKQLFLTALGVLGLNLTLKTPLYAYMLALFLLIFNTNVLIPLEKSFVFKIKEFCQDS